MYIDRSITTKIQQARAEYPVISIFGPRQSGKTTLAEHIFADHAYVNLKHLENRDFAIKDPKGFIAQYQNKAGMILDEIRNAPQLLSYLQTVADEAQIFTSFFWNKYQLVRSFHKSAIITSYTPKKYY